MSALSDDTIQEFIDGRLPAGEAAAVAVYLATNPHLRRKVAELLVLNEMLRGLGAYILEEPVPDRLTDAARSRPPPAHNSSKT